jgi:hypothetical protein
MREGGPCHESSSSRSWAGTDTASARAGRPEARRRPTRLLRHLRQGQRRDSVPVGSGAMRSDDRTADPVTGVVARRHRARRQHRGTRRAVPSGLAVEPTLPLASPWSRLPTSRFEASLACRGPSRPSSRRKGSPVGTVRPGIRVGAFRQKRPFAMPIRRPRQSHVDPALRTRPRSPSRGPEHRVRTAAPQHRGKVTRTSRPSTQAERSGAGSSPPFERRARSRSRNFCTLPVEVFAISPNTIRVGHL